VARSQSEAHGEMFARGIFPDPAPLFTREMPADTVLWFRRPAGGRLGGKIFSDGSALHPKYKALRRSGWALVEVTDDGEIISAVCGPVPFEISPD